MNECQTIVVMVFLGLGMGTLFVVIREQLGIPV